jgi:cytochrome c-type biogenesis protein CcmH/NrfG
MSDTITCPSCTHVNEPGATICAQCNFPLVDGPPQAAPAHVMSPPPVEAEDEAPDDPAPSAPAAAPSAPAAHEMPAIDRRRMRPIRPRRPKPAEQALQTQLVVGLGGLAIVITILWVAWQGFHKNNAPEQAVPGATQEQMNAISLARGELDRDSTNVNAQIALANVLYDTANWPEAIVHYKSALRLDPTRVTTVVDMGVCYFNLGDATTAESLFDEALTMDPRQPIAMFNLGIVAESRGDNKRALDFFQRALHSSPPPGMTEALNASIQRVQGKAGGGMPPGGNR